MKVFFAASFFLLVSIQIFSQGSDLVDFEKKIEKAVVAADVSFLKNCYTEDYRFKHGSGTVENKSAWLKSIEKAKGDYLLRQLDSVEVEIHGKTGITEGWITVSRKTPKGIWSYKLKYVRVYVKNDDHWQMMMHRTVFQKDVKL